MEKHIILSYVFIQMKRFSIWAMNITVEDVRADIEIVLKDIG